MSDHLGDADVDEALTPSCRFVLFVLEECGGKASRRTLLEETGLPERTLDRALDRLQNGDHVFKTRDNEDLRRVVVHYGE